MLNNTNTKARGFTLVELLIVIVVIAILAAISVVAYNGITNRGKTSSGAAYASQIVKKVEAYNSLYGKYPDYCELVTNSPSPTGTPPAVGTTGANTCAAGGTSAGTEPRLDDITKITPSANATGSDYTVAISNNNTVVAYYTCGDAVGSNVYYWDFQVTTANVKIAKAGSGCS